MYCLFVNAAKVLTSSAIKNPAIKPARRPFMPVPSHFQEAPTRFLSRVRRTSANALVECCLTLVLRHATLRPRLVGGSRQGFILDVDVHAISQVWIEVQQPRKRRVQKVKGNDWGTSFARLLPHKDGGDCGERWQ